MRVSVVISSADVVFRPVAQRIFIAKPATRLLLARFCCNEDDKQLSAVSQTDYKLLYTTLQKDLPNAFANLFEWNARNSASPFACHPVLRPTLLALSKPTSLARSIRNASRLAPLLILWSQGGKHMDLFQFADGDASHRANFLLLSDSCVFLHVLMTQNVLGITAESPKLVEAIRPLVQSMGEFLVSLVSGRHSSVILQCRVCHPCRQAEPFVFCIRCRPGAA